MTPAHSVNRSLLRLGVAPFALLCAANSFAQPADSPQAPEGETIIVTGSRLSRIDLDSASPVSLVSSQDIQLKGAVNVDEFLNDMPQAYPIQSGQSNNPGDGSSWIDLRGLGAERTLVLVNGRRWMPYDVTQIVDLNTIPAQLIDRTEVLTGGRSAVYGSDAISGVVNFVLKKDFEGVAVDSQYRITGKGDGGTWGTSVILGGNFNEGRGNATIYIDYTKRNAIKADERSFSRRTISDDGEGGFYYGGSGSIPGGRANWGSGYQLFQADGSFRPYSSTTDAYNFAPDNYLQLPQERWLIGSMAHYEVSDHLDVYSELTYVNNRVNTQLAPTPITQTGDPQYNLNIHVYSPFLSPAAQAALAAADTDGNGYVTATTYGRRMSEVGPRISNNEREAFRALLGARGDITGDWKYDAYYSYARTSTLESQYGNVSRSRFAAATATVFRNPADPSQVSVTPVAGWELACAAGAPAGCVPANIYGPGNVGTDAAKFLAVDTKNSTHITEQVASAVISNNNLFNFGLGAEAVGIAVGTEWRRVEGDFAPDFILSSGDVAGFNAGQPTGGSYNVNEFFGELVVPIMAERPFAYRLELNGAARYSDYSNSVGGVFTWAAGGQWAPIRDLTIRGQYQRAIRAPSISALYLGPAEDFPPFTDYCFSSAALSNPALAASCQATGVPAVNLGNDTLSQSQVRAVGGGNPNLKEETSDTWTVGAVLQPTFAPRLSFSVDYYEIKIEDAILAAGPGADFTRDACYGTEANGFQPYDQSFCNYIHRDTSGEITRVDDTNLNAGYWKTRGIDFELQYGIPLGFGVAGEDSRLDLRVSGTRLLQFDFNNLAAIPDLVSECLGKFGATCGNPYAKWRGFGSATWLSGPAMLQVRANYTGPVDDDGSSGYTAAELYRSHIGGYVTFDLAASYAVDEHFTARIGVNNVGDRKPPLIGDANSEQTNTYPATYDVVGRRFFVGVSAKF